MSRKTLVIDDDVHAKILEKKKELKDKYGINIEVSSIGNKFLRKAMDNFYSDNMFLMEKI